MAFGGDAIAAAGLDPSGVRGWIPNAAGYGIQQDSTSLPLLNLFGVPLSQDITGAGAATVSHTASDIGLTTAVGLAGFEGEVDTLYYTAGDALFTRVNWEPEYYAFPRQQYDMEYVAGYSWWHANALLDHYAYQNAVRAGEGVPPKRARSTFPGRPRWDAFFEDGNPPTAAQLAGVLSTAEENDTGRVYHTSKHHLQLLGLIGPRNDAVVPNMLKADFRHYGIRFVSRVAVMPNIFLADVHEEIGVAYADITVDNQHPYPYPTRACIVDAAGEKFVQPDPGSPYVFPQLLPVVREATYRSSDDKIFEEDTDCYQRWTCRALEGTGVQADIKHVTPFARVRFAAPSRSKPTQLQALLGMRTHEGWKHLRNATMGDDMPTDSSLETIVDDFGIQLDLSMVRRSALVA